MIYFNSGTIFMSFRFIDVFSEMIAELKKLFCGITILLKVANNVHIQLFNLQSR